MAFIINTIQVLRVYIFWADRLFFAWRPKNRQKLLLPFRAACIDMIKYTQHTDSYPIPEGPMAKTLSFRNTNQIVKLLVTKLTKPLIYLVPALGIMGSAMAQSPEAVATFRDWSVFVKDVSGDKICFAATEARNKQPSSLNHGDVFFLVATWQSGAATNQPSFMTGYTLKDSPEPSLRIGSDRWEMYASENEAFIESDSDERRLITAMRRGADMRVSAVSSRGNATSYTISLRGISAALDRVKTACR